MTPPITVLIADDHPIFRTGLRHVLDTEPAIHVVAEAGDADATLNLVASTAPDVVVLDIDMPGRDGLHVARALRDRQSNSRVVVLSMHGDAWFLNAALRAGVHGYVPKDCATAEIVIAIKRVHAGESYVSPTLSGVLADRDKKPAAAPALSGLGALTPTERTVLKLVAEIRTTKEIAEALDMSPRTVEHHRTTIAGKLDLKGTHALTRFAVQHQATLRDV